MERVKKPWPRFVRWSPILVALLVVGIYGYSIVADVRSASASLPTQLRLARAEGLAVEPSDLYRSVPPQDNAAPLYEKAIDAFDKRPFDATNNRLQDLNHFLADASSAASVQASLEKWSPTLKLAEQAAARPECDFKHVWQAGAGSEYADLKCFVKLFSARALLTRNLRDLDTARRISIHAGSDPTLASALAEAQCNRIWMDAAWRFAKANDDDVAVVIATRQLVAQAEMPNLKSRLKGELVLARARIRKMTFKRDENASDLDPAAEAAGDLGGKEIAVQAAESRLISLFRKLNETMPQDTLDWSGQIEGFRAVCNADQERFSARLNPYLMPPLPEVAKECRHISERAQAIQQAITLLLSKPRPQPAPIPNLS